MKCCFVFGCKSGYKNRNNEGKNWHFFHPPKNNPPLFEKWSKMCFRNRNITEMSVVCHLHFRECDIVKQKRFLLTDGSVHIIEYKRWSLKTDAYPCVFEAHTIHSITDEQRLYLAQNQPEPREPDLEPPLPTYPIVERINEYQTRVYPHPYYSAGNQTANEERTARERSLKNLYLKWKRKYFCLQRKMKRLEMKTNAAAPPSGGGATTKPNSGIYVSFENLNAKEKMYVEALARKGRLKSKQGMRYTPEYMMEVFAISCKGKKIYNCVREHSGQVLPHYRTIQRMAKNFIEKGEPNLTNEEIDESIESQSTADDAAAEDEEQGVNEGVNEAAVFQVTAEGNGVNYVAVEGGVEDNHMIGEQIEFIQIIEAAQIDEQQQLLQLQLQQGEIIQNISIEAEEVVHGIAEEIVEEQNMVAIEQQ